MLGDQGLLGKFLPLVAFIAANQRGLFQHPILRETSVLCLSRCMTLSSIVCDQYLSLLFTLLETEADVIKTTIVVAIGDLAFRFPNATEPWTAKMYLRLSDTSILVS